MSLKAGKSIALHKGLERMKWRQRGDAVSAELRRDRILPMSPPEEGKAKVQDKSMVHNS